jgi:hypothetical protein
MYLGVSSLLVETLVPCEYPGRELYRLLSIPTGPRETDVEKGSWEQATSLSWTPELSSRQSSSLGDISAGGDDTMRENTRQQRHGHCDNGFGRSYLQEPLLNSDGGVFRAQLIRDQIRRAQLRESGKYSTKNQRHLGLDGRWCENERLNLRYNLPCGMSM